jgi:uncharacterized membrane protein
MLDVAVVTSRFGGGPGGKQKPTDGRPRPIDMVTVQLGRLINTMESRLRIAGQAVQPVLVMVPLGLFAMAVLFDLGNLLGGPAILGALAYWNVAAGLVTGVFAALAGAIDLLFVRNGTRAKRMGVLLNLVNMGVLILFAVIFMLRMRTTDRVAGPGLFLIELLALGVAVVGAWYGGELVNRRRAPAFARVEAGHRSY